MALTAILGVTGLISALGSLASASAQSNAAKYNAQLAGQNAVLATQTAAENERRQRVANTKALGQMRAGYAASGVTLDGSPSDVLDESASNAELDALSIRHGGAVAAMGYENTARLDRYRASSAMTGGYFGAAGDLLRAGGSIYYLNRTG